MAHRRVTQWASIQEWPSSGELVSYGHAAGRYLVEIRVSPNARQAYANLVAGTELPVRAVVVALHRDRDTGKPGPVYVMRKSGDGRWQFAQADPNGTVVPDARTDLCARCHADGVSDSLFRVPPPVPTTGTPAGAASAE